MLLDRALDLRTTLDKHRELKAASVKAKTFRTRADQFAPLANDLQNADVLRRALQSEGVATVAPKPLPQTRQQAQTLLAKFRDDRDSFAEADPSVRFEFSSALKAAIAARRDEAAEAWRDQVEGKAEASLDQVLVALGSLPAYAAAVARIRDLDGVIIALRENTPAPDDIRAKLDALDAAVEARAAAMESIEGGDVPAAVLAFLRKVSQGGAALDDFTTEVKDWLVGRKAISDFRIVSSRSSVR